MKELYHFIRYVRNYGIGLILWVAFGYASVAQPTYLNTADERGIDTYKTNLSIGNGVSFRDFNNDGLDDLTFGTEYGQYVDFYINEGGSFRKIDPLIDNQEEVKQVLWVDFDNDGDQDLYLATTAAINRLYERVGDLELVDITEQADLSLKVNFSYGATFGDFNRDGWLDLYYGEREWPVGNSQLYVNDQDGTFTKITINSNTYDDEKLPFCSAFFDYDNDNWPDLYTAQDKLRVNTMLRNNRDCTFSDVSVSTGSNLRMNAMCVAVGDYDNDGWQDVYVTNTPVGNSLLRNIPNEDQFEEIAEETGTGFYGNGWGSNFLDADNDGYLDLYVCGSIVGSDVISNVFYRNKGDGTFEQPDYGFEGDTVSSYTNAFGDFNQDGYPDIAVKNDAPFEAQFWENSGHTNNWFKISLTGVMSNRDGVGALVKVHANGMIQSRTTHCGLGFLGQNTHDSMFGLEESELIDSIQVLWPTGHIDRLYNISVNQRVVLEEGSTTGGVIDLDPNISRNCRALEDEEEILEPEEPEDPEVILSVSESASLFFPNPASDRITLSQTLKGAKVTILDLSGKTHISQRNQSGFVDLSLLEPNMYVLTIYHQGKVTSAKLLKR